MLTQHARQRLELRISELSRSGRCYGSFIDEIYEVITHYACKGEYTRIANDRYYLCKKLNKCSSVTLIIVFTYTNDVLKIITIIPTTKESTEKRFCG